LASIAYSHIFDIDVTANSITNQNKSMGSASAAGVGIAAEAIFGID